MPREKRWTTQGQSLSLTLRRRPPALEFDFYWEQVQLEDVLDMSFHCHCLRIGLFNDLEAVYRAFIVYRNHRHQKPKYLAQMAGADHSRYQRLHLLSTATWMNYIDVTRRLLVGQTSEPMAHHLPLRRCRGKHLTSFLT